ncbi:hypothetical protein FS749_002894 [Ceratobasidium sp. UAMH 11750]|nr:hypothetical protein FS749_002894 [Ceratobasidium sp. UAMH 11750]
MAAQENIWGLEFDQYSRQKFEPRAIKLSEEEVRSFIEVHKVLPLEYGENALRIFDPRDPTLGEVTTGVPLGDQINRLWEYMSLSDSKEQVFRYYYGFLCVRHLLYTTCFTIVEKMHSTDRVLGSLHPDASWSDWCQAMTIEALDIVAEVMTDIDLFEEFCKLFTQSRTFISDSSGSETKTPLLISALWDHRESFLTLCSHGLLPGCTLLLALLKLLSIYSKRDSVRTQLVYLQDLGFRLYLVGSHRDRQILHFVCTAATQKGIDCGGENKRVKSPEDSRTIAQAYYGLFLVSQQGADTKSLSIDFMGHLTGFVLHTTGWNPSATVDEMIGVGYAALQFLWLFLQHRGRIPAEDHHKVRFFATSMFGFFGYLQRKHISTREQQYRFAEMLTQAEIVALTGRVILLVIEEGNEFQDLELLDRTIEEMSELEDPINKSAAVAPELFLDSKLEWAKVSIQVKAFAEMTNLNLSDEKIRYLAGLFEGWERYTGMRRDYNNGPWKCMYPRCFQFSLTEPKSMCGRCKEAVYCDSACQHGHWQLATSESHRLKCRPLND